MPLIDFYCRFLLFEIRIASLNYTNIFKELDVAFLFFVSFTPISYLCYVIIWLFSSEDLLSALFCSPYKSHNNWLNTCAENVLTVDQD